MYIYIFNFNFFLSCIVYFYNNFIKIYCKFNVKLIYNVIKINLL